MSLASVYGELNDSHEPVGAEGCGVEIPFEALVVELVIDVVLLVGVLLVLGLVWLLGVLLVDVELVKLDVELVVVTGGGGGGGGGGGVPESDEETCQQRPKT